MNSLLFPLLSLSSLLISLSTAATNNCDKDIAIGSFVFKIPSPNVPSYQYYYNGTDVKYMVDLSDLVFDVTGSVGNLPSWNWYWDCGANICPYPDYCFFTFYGSSKKSPQLNITMENSVTPFGLKFTVTLSGDGAGALLSQNHRLDYLFGFTCTQGACGNPVSLYSLQSAGLYSDNSTSDFSVVSIVGNSVSMSNSSGELCSIDSSEDTKVWRERDEKGREREKKKKEMVGGKTKGN